MVIKMMMMMEVEEELRHHHWSHDADLMRTDEWPSTPHLTRPMTVWMWAAVLARGGAACKERVQGQRMFMLIIMLTLL
jgi:galactitol-specific phosphotransferase system IIB component